MAKLHSFYGWVVFHCVCVCVCACACFSHVPLFATLWTIAQQAPLSMGILQARILEWVVAISYSRGSSWPRDGTCTFYVSCIGRWRRQWHPTPVLLPGKSHGQRSLVGCSPWGHYESDTTEQLHFHFSLSRIGEGNGNPLQCSCLENPRDGGAWWAAIYGVTQSQIRLKRLSGSSIGRWVLYH